MSTSVLTASRLVAIFLMFTGSLFWVKSTPSLPPALSLTSHTSPPPPSLQPVPARVVRAGPHRQERPPRGVGSQGRSFRPEEGRGLGGSSCSDRFQKLLWFLLGQLWCSPATPPHPRSLRQGMWGPCGRAGGDLSHTCTDPLDTMVTTWLKDNTSGLGLRESC